MPRTTKTLVFNDPSDNIQITAHRLRSSTDMSLNIDTSHNLYVTSDNFVLNASDLSTNVTVRAPNYYIDGISLEQYISDKTSGGGEFVLQNEDASLNNVDISGYLKLTNANALFNVAGTSRLQGLFAGATDISDTLQVDGAATLSSTLQVDGATTLQDLSAGATDISSTLNVTGATTLSSTLQLDNAATLSSSLTVAGASTLQDLSAGATDISSTLSVTGATTLSSTLAVTNAATFSSSIEVTSDSSFNSSLYVNSNLTVSNELIIGDSSSRGGRIYSGAQNNNIIIDPYAIDSNGGTDASGAVYIYGDLYVNGNTVSVSSTEITLDDKDLHLVPNESNSTLLNGAGILVGVNSTATLTYNSTSNEWQTNIGLDVSGALTTKSLTSSGAISGTTITASSDVTFSQNLDVSGLDVSNNATVGGTLGVTGATTMTSATLSSTLGVTGKLTASGGIDISGDILPTTTSSHIPVTYNTYAFKDKSDLDDVLLTTIMGDAWVTATNYNITKTLLSSNSAVKLEFKVNYICSQESEQYISFRVIQGSGGEGGGTTVVFQDLSLGNAMGVTARNVYYGSYIDTSPYQINPTYTLQFKVSTGTDGSLDLPSGIYGYTSNQYNYISLQELYVPE